MRINNGAKLFFYMEKLLLFKLRLLFPFFLVAGTLLGGILFLSKQTKLLTPTVLICNEDDSFIGNMLLNGILNQDTGEAVSFRKVSFEEGKTLLQRGRASCMLYVGEGTANTLLTGERVNLVLYVRDEKNGFAQFVKDYVEGFLKVINTAQNAGLFYMDILYDRGMDEKEREAVFQELQFTYSTKALLRNEVFEGKKEEKIPLTKEGAYFLLILLLAGYSVYSLKKHDLLKREMRERLLLVGYTKKELYFAYFLHSFVVDALIFGFVIGYVKLLGIG